MDPRDSPQYHHHNHHHEQQQIHQQQQHQQIQQQQQQIPFHHHHALMGSNYGVPNNNNSMSSLHSGGGNMLNPNFTYPFNRIMSAATGTNSKPFDSSITHNNFHNSSSDNRRSMSNNGLSYGLSYDSGLLPQRPSLSLEQQLGEKRNRGRPRKIVAEGTTTLRLSSEALNDDDLISPPAVSDTSRDTPVKRGRGRPPGSGKKQLDALGPGGVGFTPHVIMCEPGEDIASKIVAFSRQATRTVCILSANGAISSVTLKKPSLPCGTVKYEDQYQIISLKGSFSFSESDGDQSGGLNIAFAGKDDHVLGGPVAGAITAATPVQVIVASFVPEVKKPSSNNLATKPSSGPAGQLVSFEGPIAAGAAASSPPSNGNGSNDSSDENGSSPLDGTTAFGQAYNNNNNGIQTNHGIPYHNMKWPPSI